MLQKFQIKYGWKGYEIRNNVSYKGFHRLVMDFELKFR
jgi:hypothetical protein